MNKSLSYNGCWISVEDLTIKCSYDAGSFFRKNWQIVLSESEMAYSEAGRPECIFKIDDVKEFQFEMINGGGRYEDHPAANAYIVLKSDNDPKEFFYFKVVEEYVLLNNTRAHTFCSEILFHISEKYSIPFVYKLSVDTKGKHGRMTWTAFIVMLAVLLWAILFYLSTR